MVRFQFIFPQINLWVNEKITFWSGLIYYCSLNKVIRNAVFDAIGTLLSYQLNAVRKLREDLGGRELKKPSQPDIVLPPNLDKPEPK